MTNAICDNIDRIKQEIPSTTRLIAVSKQASPAAIRTAYTTGVRDFAENRLQDALSKQEKLQDLSDICWHFIGHIQSKKAKKIITHFDWIHSVDSLKLAQRLDRLSAELGLSPKVCLQVKVLSDPDKYGWHPSELLADLPVLDRCEHLQIRGLMTILPWGLSAEQTLSAFQSVKSLADQIQQQSWSFLKMEELSMGMSGDYKLAVRAGATMIRPGRIIFGSN
ncbi:Pyridoxal phosphate homeostasis protein [Hyella patelloides LEGE 07179]|uniref:Pyridoxal phosphate homeostasis protein n=1 Tax=Hyella patelloides LEGE 07179 TaxID=945734 RepID=A0A563VJZ7_9CYAN|nr:YggS family pyridoxal phosphate-dependent enzyme [Hyella patelloides]VEP11806.1 Pyridoxal phosphate homeostasis protein [Hyella patelloides LEGE 07179]